MTHTGHTTQATVNTVHLVHGSVEVSHEKISRKTGKVFAVTKHRQMFSNVTLPGTDMDELRRNFRYAKIVPKAEKAKARDMERRGLVRLLDLQSDKVLGLQADWPAAYDCDEYI